VRPALPARVSQLFDREERFDVLPGEYDAVRDYVLARAAR
jgi:threonine synthase